VVSLERLPDAWCLAGNWFAEKQRRILKSTEYIPGDCQSRHVTRIKRLCACAWVNHSPEVARWYPLAMAWIHCQTIARKSSTSDFVCVHSRSSYSNYTKQSNLCIKWLFVMSSDVVVVYLVLIVLLSAAGQPTRPTQPFILSESINEQWAAIGCPLWWRHLVNA